MRARPGDTPLLVDHFLTQFNRTSPKQIRGVRPRVLERLCRYAWPGNIRELENAINRSAILADYKLKEL